MDSLSHIEQSITFAASDIWQTSHPFQKTNQQLWIEMNRVKKFISPVTKMTVREVIPESRLARYVDSHYDADRELSYPNGPDTPQPTVNVPDANEPWMLPEVDELWRKFQTPTRVIHTVNVAHWIQETYPGLVKTCRPDGHVNAIELPGLELSSLSELELQMRIRSTKKFWLPGIQTLSVLPKRHNFLNPFLLRSVQEWQNQVLNELRGFPELTNLLRNTRTKNEVVDYQEFNLPEKVSKIEPSFYQLWTLNFYKNPSV